MWRRNVQVKVTSGRWQYLLHSRYCRFRDWIKIEVRRIPMSRHAPDRTRYSLTLHDKYGTRVLGDDNAVKP